MPSTEITSAQNPYRDTYISSWSSYFLSNTVSWFSFYLAVQGLRGYLQNLQIYSLITKTFAVSIKRFYIGICSSFKATTISGGSRIFGWGCQPIILPNILEKIRETRVHSSKMRTARSSSRLGGLHQTPPWTRHPPRTRHTPPGARHPPHEQTHTGKHITLPQISFAGGNYFGP